MSLRSTGIRPRPRRTLADDGSLLDWMTGGQYSQQVAAETKKNEPGVLDKIFSIFAAAQASKASNAATSYQLTMAQQQAAAAAARTQQMLIIGGVAVVGLFIIMRKD